MLYNTKNLVLVSTVYFLLFEFIIKDSGHLLVTRLLTWCISTNAQNNKPVKT